jgi:predicted O-methyltransferase YrrM
MSSEPWIAADLYLHGLFTPEDAALTHATASSASAGLPSIAVTPSQGKWLHLQARAIGAKRILELGALGGYSTIWLARALRAGGVVVSLELEPKHAEVAQRNIHHAGLSDRVQIRVGPALESLAGLVAEGATPFDLIFIDADKPSYPDYLTWALKLSRPGTVIIADNVVRSGKVADDTCTDANVQGARRFNAMLAAEPRVGATVLQTVGEKGHDGFAFAVVER